MAPFEELQQLWQGQTQRAVPERDAAALSSDFRRYGRRHALIYLGKTVVVACQLIFLAGSLRHRPLALFGACTAAFIAILFIVSACRPPPATSPFTLRHPP